jgi:hypothetical protein
VKYEYKVTVVDYSATGEVAGGTESVGGCVPYKDADFTGRVVTSDDDVEQLRLGAGKLTIGRHGSHGMISATKRTKFAFSDGEHDLVTECNGDGLHPGQQTDTKLTQCPAASKNVAMEVIVKIAGKVGDKVKLRWAFEGPGRSQYMVPDFSCVETFEFPYRECTTWAKLAKFTSKTVRLPLGRKCFAQTSTRPPYTYYVATSIVRASIVLERTAMTRRR